jgi:hypothetical protein
MSTTIHEGDLIVGAGQTVTTDATLVTGDVTVWGGGTLNAPQREGREE